MFDASQQFYPTPGPIAYKVWRKAIDLLQGRPSTVFDPSGGKGDLFDTALNVYSSSIKCFSVEIDPDLRSILREKGVKVLGSDFLEFSDPVEFECILMNPPFNKGEHHALRAWQLVAPEGVIVGLLNLSTIEYPRSSEQQRLASLIEEHGGWEDLGSCFEDAERKTSVPVAMFWMKRPEKIVNPNEFQFSGKFERAAPETFEEFASNPLASSDAIDSLVGQYRVCVDLLKKRSTLQSELNYHLGSLASALQKDKDETTLSFNFGKDLVNLKYRMWRSVFKMTRMNEIGTSDFQAKFDTWVLTQVDMEFSRSNILEALAMFFQSREQIIIDSICSVFDRATAYHADNKVHPEGWKTNSGWKLNRKIIIPSGVKLCPYFGSWDIKWGDKSRSFFSDLDEILCRLAGKPQEEAIGLLNMIDDRRQSVDPIAAGKWHGCRWYRVKLFKKGTVHLEFSDPYLLDDLNAIVAKERKWLGTGGK